VLLSLYIGDISDSLPPDVKYAADADDSYSTCSNETLGETVEMAENHLEVHGSALKKLGIWEKMKRKQRLFVLFNIKNWLLFN